MTMTSPYTGKAWPKKEKISPLSAAAGFGVSFLAGMADQYRRASPEKKKEMKGRLTGMFSDEPKKEAAPPPPAPPPSAPELPEVLDNGSLGLTPPVAPPPADSDAPQLDAAVAEQLAAAAPAADTALTAGVADQIGQDASPYAEDAPMGDRPALSDPQQFSAAFSDYAQPDMQEPPQMEAPADIPSDLPIDLPMGA